MKDQNKKQVVDEMAEILRHVCEGECFRKEDYSVDCDVCQALHLYDNDYRKQSGWISVEDRLPDCEYGAETEALLFRLKTGSVEAGYFGTGGRFRDKYFRCYHHANEGWDAKDVTHWMPLPDAPKNP